MAGKAQSEGQSAGVGESVAPQGSRLNVELLRKVRDAIADEKNPVGFDMADWGWEDHCGTVACIAGHTAVQAGLGLAVEHVNRAGELLGLDEDEEEYLFFWTWHRGRGTPTRAEAVAYLDRCIAAEEIVR